MHDKFPTYLAQYLLASEGEFYQHHPAVDVIMRAFNQHLLFQSPQLLCHISRRHL